MLDATQGDVLFLRKNMVQIPESVEEHEALEKKMDYLHLSRNSFVVELGWGDQVSWFSVWWPFH